MNKQHTFTYWTFIILLLFVQGCASKKNVQKMSKKQKGEALLAASVDTTAANVAPVSSDSAPIEPSTGKTVPATPEMPNSLFGHIEDQSKENKAKHTLEKSATASQEKTTQLLAQLDTDQDLIEFYFENAELEELIKQVGDIYKINFITDETITANPPPPNVRALKGNKISFKTQVPLSKKEAWSLFNNFLSMAGFAIIQEPIPHVMRITSLDAARYMPLPTFINVPPNELPDSDELVRYVYFIENTAIEPLRIITEALKSPVARPAYLLDSKTIIIADKSSNIRGLITILKELDKVTMPQAMSVLKLRRADAREVKQLYDTIIQADDKNVMNRVFPTKRQPTSLYFPDKDNTRIIAEPRTNALILLGSQDAIKRVEDFITTYVDVELTQPYSPLHVIQLKYADANTIADIMNNVIQFGKNTEAGKNGGVRGGDKYFKPMFFTAEPETNRLVVKGDYDDFLKAKDIVMQLDEPQPQVAIEVLLLSISLIDTKQLGAQIRSRAPGTGIEGLVGPNVKFQTSGLNVGNGVEGIIENPNGSGNNRLLGDLINLVSGATAGNTIVSLGDALGVWGIFQALQSISNTQVLANPFLVATNKAEAKTSLGETRRVITGTVVNNQSVNTFGDADANLTVKVKPQINSDGMIVLDLDISLSTFLTSPNPDNVARNTKQVVTKTIVADKEVLALGGLIQTTITNNESSVPILGSIPILGWLFKNKGKGETKQDLLILVSSHIIEPLNEAEVKRVTQRRIDEYKGTIDSMNTLSDRRDPIHQFFFDEKKNASQKHAEHLLFERQRKISKRAQQKEAAKKKIDEQIHDESATSLPTSSVEQQPSQGMLAAAQSPPKQQENALSKKLATRSSVKLSSADEPTHEQAKVNA